MNPPSLSGVIAIAAVAGGVIGGGVAWAVAGGRASSPKSVSSAMAGTDADERLAALERRMAQAERRSLLRPATPAGGTPAAPNPLPPTAAQGQPEEADVADPVFEAAVRDVMLRVDEERENERQMQRDEQRQAAAQRWAADLTERLGLREDQKAKLLTLAREFYDQMRETFRGDAGAGAAPGDRREKVQALRKQYDEKLGTVLDGTQLGEYQKLDEGMKLGSRLRRAPAPPDR
jgi:hypothetical protein